MENVEINKTDAEKSITLLGRYITLEPLNVSHVCPLFLATRDPGIWTYLPVFPPAHEAEMERLISTALRARDSGAEIPFAIRHTQTGAIIGSTRYLAMEPQHRSLEIGYTFVSSEYQRTIVNTEAKYLLLTNAFEIMHCVRVQIKTDLRNLRAQRAIERLGAVKEGILRKQRVLPDGYIRDAVMYSIIEEEWPSAKLLLEDLYARCVSKLAS